ncbi:hypothetical protein RUM_15810 [Ruminococcus champanellensis 18P13 = JCM 17042]|uniref:Uncharacterized protein n=1 Tax=Ruminococcus champanellensis (strain DSM 18848 / JCM 17042 / KCTC 15320 / 18P13) TaxID=213810 RepID=D4LDH4_RUMC1|nr:hypothetical protein RUM_15810 [Ruminococcus champanellensis 18P13 = JCM 17042]
MPEGLELYTFPESD